MKRLSDAASRLEGQPMFQILARAKELERSGKEVLHFELGDLDFNTPSHIVEGAYNALKNGETHYAPSNGILELRLAAAEVTQRSRGFKPELDQILVTPGANVQIYYAVACTANPGDEVIVPDPGFVSYFSILKLLNIGINRVPLHEENGFRIDPSEVEKRITGKTRMIIMNSPSNPTGAVMTEQEVKEMYEIAKRHDLFLLSDEIYARMIFKDANTNHYSPSRYDSCRERTIVVNGFSKSYAMTGWRLGVVTGPSDVISKMGLMLETTTSCVSPFIQRAGINALRNSQSTIDSMISEYRDRRDILVRGLNTLPGVKCNNPGGAFYAFPSVTGTGMSSNEFCEVMLNEAGVSLAPGPIFGDNGEGYVRMCYANSKENIQKAIGKMRDLLENNHKYTLGD